MSATDRPAVAVLYQATPPPVIDGIRKPMKPGGYADSGADIAYVLDQRGVEVVTPAAHPDPVVDADWVFPDTSAGIEAAVAKGATVLWANSVLFAGHPLEAAIAGGAWVVGQRPAAVHEFDDKWRTNEALRAAGSPVAASFLVGDPEQGGVPVADVTAGLLAEHDVGLPAVVKPVRGRGSEGVTRVGTVEELVAVARELLDARVAVDGKAYATYGHTVMVEEYLEATEVTLTVMPPGCYELDGVEQERTGPWSLPPVERFNHVDGITPYNGVVAVTRNSRVVPLDAALGRLVPHCERAADIVGAVAPIRIDCRARADGEYVMFDLNMKPNMTGAGRPGRDDQDSLSCMAARAVGWSYGDLLLNMLRQRWREDATVSV